MFDSGLKAATAIIGYPTNLLLFCITLIGTVHLLLATCCKNCKNCCKKKDDKEQSSKKSNKGGNMADGNGNNRNGSSNIIVTMTSNEGTNHENNDDNHTETADHIRKNGGTSTSRSYFPPDDDKTPPGHVVGNIDEKIRSDPPEEIVSGIGTQHKLNDSPQVKDPSPTDNVKMLEDNNLVFLTDASRTKSSRSSDGSSQQRTLQESGAKKSTDG